MKKLKKRKKESGQAVVEFAIVLPLFLLLVMGIIDFGWLFYNYISVENAARNAARIACVEYTECCYDQTLNLPATKNTFLLTECQESYDEDTATITSQENDVIKTVKHSLPVSVKNAKVTINYTYDTQRKLTDDYVVTNRSTGDVIITISGEMKVLTPVLGVTCKDPNKPMTKVLNSSSTFKVELKPSSGY